MSRRWQGRGYIGFGERECTRARSWTARPSARPSPAPLRPTAIGRSWRCRPMRRAAICRRASRSPTARPAGASPSWRRSTARRATALGHRVATLLENHPDHILHKLALNSIGACLVPINPDYRAAETAYLIEHSRPDLVVTLGSREGQVAEALAQGTQRRASAGGDRVRAVRVFLDQGARGRRRAASPSPGRRPACSTRRARRGGPRAASCRTAMKWPWARAMRRWAAAAALHPGQDRIYNPLPLYHANSGVFSLFGAILSGNCQIQPDRFHPRALVARDRRDPGHRRALPRHHRRHAAQPAAGRARASARRALRHRRRRRAAAPSRRSRSASAFP